MRPVLVTLTMLYVGLLPFERVLSSASGGEDTVFKPYRVVSLLILVLWSIWRARMQRAPKAAPETWALLSLFAWGAVMALCWSLVEVLDLDLTRRGLVLIGFGFVNYLLTNDLALDRAELRKLLNVYVAALFTAAAISLVLSDLSGRFSGFYKNPNQLGVAAVTAMLVFITQFLYLPRPTVVGQLARAVGAAICVALIALSGSRGATAGGVLAMVVLLVVDLVAMPDSRKRIVRLGGFLVLASAVGVFAYPRFERAWEATDSQLRFRQNYAQEGAEGRWDLWISGANVGMNHYGVGCGSFQYLSHHLSSMKELGQPTSHQDRPLGTHSDYVDLFASYGVPGVLLYAFVLQRRARGLWAEMKRARREHLWLSPMALALFVATLTFSVSQNSFQGPEFWVAFSIVAAMATPAPARAGAPSSGASRAPSPLRELAATVR